MVALEQLPLAVIIEGSGECSRARPEDHPVQRHRAYGGGGGDLAHLVNVGQDALGELVLLQFLVTLFLAATEEIDVALLGFQEGRRLHANLAATHAWVQFEQIVTNEEVAEVHLAYQPFRLNKLLLALVEGTG